MCYAPGAISPGWHRAWTAGRSPGPIVVPPAFRYERVPRHKRRPGHCGIARRFSFLVRSAGLRKSYVAATPCPNNHGPALGFLEDPRIRSGKPAHGKAMEAINAIAWDMVWLLGNSTIAG